MPRKHEAYLEDILECIKRVEKYTEGADYEEFSNDEKTVDAVLKNLENIGEAVKNLPEEVKNERSDLEWSDIAGFRDFITHQYFRADKEITWDIVQNEVPILKQAVREIQKNQ